MTRVAFLGLGAMGRRMAKHVHRAHASTVWSRRGVPADCPELVGAARPTAREAVADRDVILSMVTDDDASRELWLDPTTGALAAVKRGAVIVESSTLTPAWVARLAYHAQEAGVHFLDAPVVGSRPQAEAGTLVHLVGGEAAVLDAVTPVLATYSASQRLVGPTPLGAVAKLAINTLFAAQVAALAEILAGSARQGLSRTTLMDVLAALPVLSPAAAAAGAAMCEGRFEPQFPVALVAKDLRYAEAAHGEPSSPTSSVIGCVRALFEHAAATGLAEQNITAISKVFLHPSRTQGVQ